MNENKQIEEMAVDLLNCRISNDAIDRAFANVHGVKGSCFESMAKHLYDKDYRRQIRGEWVSVEGDVIFKCSICDAEISTSWDYENDYMWYFCPCCGANMTKE